MKQAQLKSKSMTLENMLSSVALLKKPLRRFPMLSGGALSYASATGRRYLLPSESASTSKCGEQVVTPEQRADT
jgi:hypothetical protein